MTRSRVAAIAPLAVAITAVFAAPHVFQSSAFQSSRLFTGSGAAATAASATREVGQGAAGYVSYDLDVRSAPPAAAPQSATPGARGTFIVMFREPALAAYQGGVPGIAVPKRRATADGRRRLDAKAAESRQYVAYLQGRQRALERRIASANRASLPVRARMQHALNAIVVDMSNAEAARVARMPEVQLVEPYREYELTTDVSPQHIGAVPVWAGSNPGAPAPYLGEGIVVGIVDTGINFGSPSFAATDPIDGHVHVNPLGAGVYLGTCAPGGPDAGRCNSKLIGGYDMICAPPTSLCGQPDVDEQPGFGDDSGHGSHTASTTAGNRRDESIGGNLRRITGIAPRANVIAFDACHYIPSEARDGCPNTATTAAFEQAIADGVVDVMNYSIAGGREPWNDTTSLAMLNAVSAGIFVAASAGNAGATPGVLAHVEPWTTSVASARHGRDQFLLRLGITGPGTVNPSISTIYGIENEGGTPLSAAFPPTTRIRVSATYSTTNDGCSAFAANIFSNSVALINEGTCSHTVKVNNAAAAGAVAVLIANNAPFYPVYPETPGGLRPAIGITLVQGSLIRTHISQNTNTTIRIDYPYQILTNTPDALSASSSRGPVAGLDLIKPDLTAPGVLILAAAAGDTITGHESALGMYSGTSMASPHVAGAAALMRQARPSWTPSEMKSALMMTATTQVYLEDNVTLANPHARGAGRLRVDRAINAGLVLNETQANFLAANPATGGQPSTLNLPSLADATCANACSFTRTFRNARSYGSLWRVQLEGLNGTVQSLLWVPMGGTASLPVTINTTGLPANGSWNFGSLVLTELFTGAQVNTASELRLPVGVVVPNAAAALPFRPVASAPMQTAGPRRR